MATLFHPYFTAAQEANIPLWALIEHAAAAASSGIDGGLQQFCNAAKAQQSGRPSHCGRDTAAEPQPCSSRQAQRNHCHRGQVPPTRGSEEVINFQDFLTNAAAIANAFLGGSGGQGSCNSTGAATTAAAKGDEVLSATMSAENGFEVKLDVSQYAPQELNVKTVENSIVIEAKHDEKQDGTGFVARSFTRRYVLPEGIKAENVTCKLASNGILILSAPSLKSTSERSIPINFTGIPASVPAPEVVSPPVTETPEATAPAHMEAPMNVDDEPKLD